MTPSRADAVSRLATRVRDECAGGGLRRASRAISRFYGAAFAPLDLTATQFTLLVAVNLGGPVPLSRLAEFLVLDRTSLYRAVKPLTRRRCLRIVPGRTGREQAAALTEAGRRLLHEALPVWKKTQERFVDALGSDAWTALNSGLRQVVPALQALESGGLPARSGPTSLRAGRR